MKKRVLILNVDLKTSKEIKYNLQNESMDAYYADSVQDALSFLKRYSVQLVIMDIYLAEANGHTLIEAMRSCKTVPILILSSSRDEKELIKAIKAGADVVMEKENTSLEYLLAQAEALMRRH